MKNLIQIAVQEIGVTEITGAESNPRIMAYAQEIGFDSWYHNDDTPWCSVFLNWATHVAGLERSKDGRAASWETMGQEVQYPEPGDIGLFTPTPGQNRITHVGIYLGYSQDHKRIYILGGNQSDQVNISGFRTDTLVAFRRLAPVEGTPTESVQAPLKQGDRGAAVVALQDTLKLAGFDVGTSDGIFGSMTANALMALQQQSNELSNTGIFDPETQAYLQRLLEERGLVSTR
jgi:uncharacterized protein (TIGR02594 family)